MRQDAHKHRLIIRAQVSENSAMSGAGNPQRISRSWLKFRCRISSTNQAEANCRSFPEIKSAARQMPSSKFAPRRRGSISFSCRAHGGQGHGVPAVCSKPKTHGRDTVPLALQETEIRRAASTCGHRFRQARSRPRQLPVQRTKKAVPHRMERVVAGSACFRGFPVVEMDMAGFS